MTGVLHWRSGFIALVTANTVVWTLNALLVLAELLGQGITPQVSL
jgi:hypothetical protein